MIDAAQALADLDTVPGELVAVPKQQMRDLYLELARRQGKRERIAMFAVAALPAPLGASA